LSTRASEGNLLRTLTEDEVERIHQGSTRVLEEIGIVVDHGEIWSLLEQAGCRIDPGSGLTKFPPKLVGEAVARAPSEVLLCGRDGQHDIWVGDGKLYARIPGGAPGILDLETRAWRPPLKQDVADIARVADALDHINGVSMFPVVPSDVAIEVVDVHAAEAAFRHTSKHLFYVCHNTALIGEVIKMAVAVAGDDQALQRRPLLSALSEATAPLRLVEDQLQVLRAFAERGLPLMLHSHPIAGLTSPVTLAGELVLTNAEILSLVVIAQLIRPGTPVVYGMSSSVPDMRSTINLAGAVEIGLLGAAVAQMAKRYGLPCAMTSGIDAKVPDAQAAMDRLLTMLPPILAGIDLVNISTTDTKLTFCLEQLVIDNEILAAVRRYLQGIQVDDETLALDLMAQVGPGGTFITTDHTVRHHRRELLLSKVLSREPRSVWEKDGAKDTWGRASERVRWILEEHRPLPLSEQAGRRIAAIVGEVERRMPGAEC
jgi:trimethylamine--corrinoid protein Co-methyltransferase